MKVLRLILGDQLNHAHSWFSQEPHLAEYVLMEVKSETDYVAHHIQKVCAFFLAMRTFAAELQANGFTVHYINLDDQNNKQSFSENIIALLASNQYSKFEYQEPDEYRVDAELKALCQNISIPSEILSSEHFFTSRTDLSQFFKGKKTLIMESFYRHMRKKHNLLMQANGEPIGDRWNFDSENRKAFNEKERVPAVTNFQNDASEIVTLLAEQGVKTIGNINGNTIPHPISRSQSIALLKYFIEEQLTLFGKYEDAMHTEHKQLFHSRLSFSLNVKLLSPAEVIDAVIEAYNKQSGTISLESVEGFVRQIIGWREFMRGVYWKEMPDYAQLNFFNHQRALPKWFWTGETKMNCLKHAIGQSLDLAYAHHIQRLMVIGNFALLFGANPREVENWYLGVYIDALEWVEITNTLGMSQFADGGIVGTKPYVSSANYINKMSNYCKGCHYNHKERVGEKACPFNSLYWNFHLQHE